MKIQPKATYGTAIRVFFFLSVTVFFQAFACQAALAASAGRVLSEESFTLGAEDVFAQEVTDSGRPDRLRWARLEGLVIDSGTRQLLAEARVSLERGRAPAGLLARNQKAMLSAVTNKRGRFCLDGIEPGVYSLRAAKRGYAPSPTHVLELEPGKTMTRDVKLDPLAKVWGRVVDESNRPVEGVRVGVMVELLRPGLTLHRLLSEEGISGLTATTDSQGEFEFFVPAEEETVTLVARALGYAPNLFGPLSVKPEEARRGILLRLPRGLEARGRVVDERGAPLSGAALLARRWGVGGDGFGFEDMEPQATSGADGNFILRGLEKGSYTMTVSHATHATRTVPEVEIQAEAANRIPDIVLLAGAEISGLVADAERHPILGTKVSGVAGEGSSTETVSDG